MRVSDLVKMCVVRKDCFENEFADKKSLSFSFSTYLILYGL